MMGGHGLGSEPLATSFKPSPVASAFQTLIESSDAETQYLLEITTYRGGEIRSGGLWTIGEGPLAAVPGSVGTSGAGQVILRYADKDWPGDPSDPDQPNVYYEGRVDVPLILERLIPTVPEQQRQVQRQFGSIEIANADSELDSIVQSFAVDGWPVVVRLGPYMGAYAEFQVVADCVGVGWESDDLMVRLNLRDRSFNLDLPLQTTLYAGTGGAEGGAEIDGKPKPLLFGKCLNVTPIALDPSNLIFQVHDGQISAVTAVYDQGAALTDSTTDVADYAALAALSVSSGQFATCLAEGMFKLGTSPTGLITADILGDADPSYVDSIGAIACRVLIDRAGVNPTKVMASTFVGAGALISGDVGVYVRSGESTADLINALLGSVGSWWGPGRDGRYRAGRLTKPEDRTPTLILEEDDIISLVQEVDPIPRWRQRVGYQRNWTVQRGEDLAASVTDARRQFLAEDLRVVSTSSASVKTRHQQALDPAPLPTLLDDSADADTVASDQLALHSPDRRVFQCLVQRLGYGAEPGAILRIASYSRFGLQTGKNFYVVGIRDDGGQDQNVLRIWG